MTGVVALMSKGLQNAMQIIANRLIEGIPQIVVAAVILVVGFIVGDILKRIIQIICDNMNLDKWVDEQNLSSALGGHKVSKIIGILVQWYTIILFLAQAADLVYMPVLKNFLQLLVFYIPSILGAVIIIIIGLLVGKYLENLIKNSTFRMKKFIAGAVKIITIYIAIVMALSKIGFDTSILIEAFKIAFTVFVVVIAILFGIAFASEYKNEIKYWSKELRKLL